MIAVLRPQRLPGRTHRCIVCLAALLAVSATAAVAAGPRSAPDPLFAVGPRPEPRPTGRIEGRVVDEQGAPVQGATLGALLSGFALECGGGFPPGTWVNAWTGADGRFTLDALRTGWFEIRVSGSELRSALVRQRVGDGQHLEGLEIVLPKAEIAFIEGRVVGANGTPVAGAQIFGSHAGGAETDRDGRFRLQKCLAGRHQLAVSHPEQGWTTVDVEARAGVNRLDVRLPRSTPVRGRIVLPDGTPLTRDLVFDLSARFVDEPGRISVDDQGEFRIGVPLGSHEIRVSTMRALQEPPLPEWPEVQVAFEATGKPLDLEIRLSEGSTISGRISGLLPGEVAAVQIDNNWPPQYARVEQDGTYRFDRLAPGTWMLEATTQHRSLHQTVEVGTETRHEVDFPFGPAVPVSGRILDAGGFPTDEMDLFFRQGDRTFRAKSGFKGTFLAFLEPGDWMAWAQAPQRGGPLTPLMPVTVHKEPIEGLEFRFAPPGTISGRLLGLAEDEIVQAVMAEGEYSDRFRVGTVDLDNGFRIFHLPPGTWTVRAGRFDREATAVVHLGPDDQDVTIDLVFPPEERR